MIYFWQRQKPKMCCTLLIRQQGAFCFVGGNIVKYKFKLEPPVKKICEWQLEQYPEEKRLLKETENDMINIRTLNYGGVRGGGNHFKRPTEENAIRIISAPCLRRMETSVNACDRVLETCDDIDRELIEILFWRKSKTATAAGMDVFLEKTAVYQRLNRILGAIAAETGFISGI